MRIQKFEDVKSWQEAKIIDNNTYTELEQRTLLISKLLTGFIKKLTTEDGRLETN